LRIALVAAALLAALAGVAWFQAAPSTDVDATLTSRALVKDVQPFGVNLGIWTSWGAEQLASNVIKNPGFEGLIDGAIVIPVHAGANSFDDSPAWLARENGFWRGARYSIRAGPEAGREGRIADSLQRNIAGLPSFIVERGSPVPSPGSVVALSRSSDEQLPTQWWYSKDRENQFAPALNQKRPGSSGSRALRITAGGSAPAEVISFFDMIGARAGKLLPLTGNWKLSFWTRLESGNASLRASLVREGAPPILAREVSLSSAWTQVVFDFEGKDDGPAGPASLRFSVTGRPIGQVLLDDVDLRRVEDQDRPFRSEVVAMLRRLRPGYLRDWEGQLGDALANRTATQFARKPYRYRPGAGDVETDFGYGLGDFFDLARDIGASPWIIVPTAFNDRDCSGLGEYLAHRPIASGRETLVEFGNENWNAIFRPGGIPDAAMLGQAADRCFEAIRAHASGARIRFVIGAQFANRESAARYGRESREANVVAIAPYIAFSMPRGQTLDARLGLLFESGTPNMQAAADAARSLGKEWAVYEVNLHTTEGDAPPAERNPVVAGAASAAALAKRMLDALSAGARVQCAYTLAGFESSLGNRGSVPLWGIARDLGATQRLRPTGLALELLNGILAGDMVAVDQRGPKDVSIFAFQSRGRESVVIVSASPEERTATLHFPGEKSHSATLQRIAAASPTSTNEDSEDVRIVSETIQIKEGKAVLRLRPWSLAAVAVGR
jgi:hypothetical protein